MGKSPPQQWAIGLPRSGRRLRRPGEGKNKIFCWGGAGRGCRGLFQGSRREGRGGGTTASGSAPYGGDEGRSRQRSDRRDVGGEPGLLGERRPRSRRPPQGEGNGRPLRREHAAPVLMAPPRLRGTAGAGRRAGRSRRRPTPPARAGPASRPERGGRANVGSLTQSIIGFLDPNRRRLITTSDLSSKEERRWRSLASSALFWGVGAPPSKRKRNIVRQIRQALIPPRLEPFWGPPPQLGAVRSYDRTYSTYDQKYGQRRARRTRSRTDAATIALRHSAKQPPAGRRRGAGRSTA